MPDRIRKTLAHWPFVVTVLAPVACDEGGDDGSDFEPTTPYDDVCGVLTTEDIAAVIPAPGPGMLEPTVDSPELWARLCTWHENDDDLFGGSVDLVLEGPLTEDGRIGIAAAYEALGSEREEVAGIGDRAVYWDDPEHSEVGFAAMHGDMMVDVTTYSVDPKPTRDQLAPLVSTALDQL